MRQQRRYGRDRGADSRGIGCDRLAIREVHNHQQRDNGRTNRKNIVNTQQTKGDQKTEGRLRAVSGRAQRVEAKNRDALGRTDLFGALVTGLNGLADYNVEDICRTDVTSLGRTLPSQNRYGILSRGTRHSGLRIATASAYLEERRALSKICLGPRGY